MKLGWRSAKTGRVRFKKRMGEIWEGDYKEINSNSYNNQDII